MAQTNEKRAQSAESLEEQRASFRNPHLYNRAVELRQTGWSYGMISEELGVSKSTLSGWLKHLPVEEYHPDVRQRVLTGQRKMLKFNKERFEALRVTADEEAVAEMQDLLADGLSDRELFLTGLMLYWAEGGKTINLISLSNSDPALVRMFILWLDRCLGVQAGQLRAEVHLYPDVDIEEAEAYWSQISGIPRAQFYKVQIDRRTGKSLDQRGKLRHGTVHIKVTGEGTSYLHRKIMRWIAALGQHVESSNARV